MMYYCPFCKTDQPNRLSVDELRAMRKDVIRTQTGYYERLLKEATPASRHWNHMKRRAESGLERFAEELKRRSKSTQGTKKAKRPVRRKAA